MKDENHWYYAYKKEKVGPVTKKDINSLILNQVLNENSYVWCRGFSSWKKINEVSELYFGLYLAKKFSTLMKIARQKEFHWQQVFDNEQIFFLKYASKKEPQQENFLGPYSLQMIDTLYQSKKINALTQVYAHGMNQLLSLHEIPYLIERHPFLKGNNYALDFSDEKIPSLVLFSCEEEQENYYGILQEEQSLSDLKEVVFHKKVKKLHEKEFYFLIIQKEKNQVEMGQGVLLSNKKYPYEASIQWDEGLSYIEDLKEKKVSLIDDYGHDHEVFSIDQ